MTLPVALMEAVQYADLHNIDLPLDLRIRARRVGAIKAGGDLASINRTYHDAITQALVNYFEKGGSGPRNQFKRAATDALGAAFDLGWTDGGQEMPPDSNALDWFNPHLEQEFANIDSLFVNAKELRKDKEFDYFTWITARADGYTNTVTSFYNAAVLLAKQNQMLTWHLGNTEKHCPTCAKLDGGKHRASWYVAHDYIPRKPGAAMDCGGYNCDCSLVDTNGDEVTI